MKHRSHTLGAATLNGASPLFLVLLLAAPFLCLRVAAAELPEMSSYENSEQLSPDFQLFWTANDSESASAVHVAMRARTSGWLALGISEVGAMIGSDAIVGWIDTTNSSAPVVFLTDRFLFNRSRNATGVALDSQQDVHLVGGQQEYNQSTGDTWTTIHFWRLLDTKDCNDRAIVPGQGQYFIWAIGTTTKTSYHGTSRGSALLTLVPSSPSIIAPPPPTGSTTSASDAVTTHRRRTIGRLPADVMGGSATGSNGRGVRLTPVGVRNGEGGGNDARYLDFRMSDYQLPAQETTYTCRAFEISLPSKTHAIGWGFTMNATDNATLHHTLLYGCQGNESMNIPRGSDTFDCLEDTICYTVVAGWALGGLPFDLPSQAGMPLGPGFTTTFVLQTHYTNPSLKSGILDSSGMYYRLADSLRPFDASVMLAGPVDYHNLIAIPPQQPSWTQDSYCPAECTASLAATATGGVNMVGSLMHLHGAGRQLYTDVYRNGQKLHTLFRQDYYDFAMQQWMAIKPFTVMPGDELRTRCVWDTLDRVNYTLGGPSSGDEMCMNFLVYYPANYNQQFGSCYSFCATYDPSVGFTATPGNPNLTTWAVCGWPERQVIDTRKSCLLNISYGANLTFQALNGCPASTLPSLSDVSDPSLISMPAQLSPTMPPSQPPSSSSCQLALPNGVMKAYGECSQLPGGFQLLWDVGNVTVGSSNGGNATVTVAFEVQNVDGWVGFGISPRGSMLGSSAIIGYVNGKGEVEVAQYYLGDYVPRPVIGGELSASQLSGESSGGNLTVFATLSLPLDQVTKSVPIIWAKGPVRDDGIHRHASSDAHIDMLTFAADGSAKAASCGLSTFLAVALAMANVLWFVM